MVGEIEVTVKLLPPVPPPPPLPGGGGEGLEPGLFFVQEENRIRAATNTNKHFFLIAEYFRITEIGFGFRVSVLHVRWPQMHLKRRIS